MNHGYMYEGTLASSERVDESAEDLVGSQTRLDFSRPFLPESLARVDRLRFLSATGKLRLNQIRGLGYVAMCGLVGELIRPDAARNVRLLRRFRAEFERGFGTPCGVVPPQALVLAHEPLAGALAILHIEWMTQRHYLDSIRDDQRLDPYFAILLKHQCMEEARRADRNTPMVEALAEGRSGEAIDRAIEGYLAIAALLDGRLRQQTALDLASLELALRRRLSFDEREAFLVEELQAQRWTFLGSGMTHPNFLAAVGALRPAARARVEAVAGAFC